MFFLLILTVVVLEFNKIEEAFDFFIKWIRENPEKASYWLILIYVVAITLIIPTTWIHLIVGYTYSQVAESPSGGFWYAAPIVSVGCMLGILTSFLVSKYCLREFVIRKIHRNASKYPWLNNFDVIDEIF